MPHAEHTARSVSHASRLLRGARLGSPIFLSYLAVGTAFGVLAKTTGLTAFQAVACSATAIAGAGQFVALSLMGSGAHAAAVLATTTVINLRYLLFATTVSPRLRNTSLPMQALLGFTLTDETFAVNTTDIAEHGVDELSMAGVGLISWLGWTGGTAIGALSAGGIGDPSRWGVDFAMPAMFTALLVAQVQGRRHLAVGILAAVLAVVLAAVLPGSWYIIVAPAAAAAVGAVAMRG